MNDNPSLNEFDFRWWQTSINEVTVRNSENRLIVLILNMNMWTMMLLIIKKLKGYDDTIKHGKDGHSNLRLIG